MRCEEFRNQLADYLADSLDQQDRSAIEEHLLACISCRDEAEALQPIWQKLGTCPSEKPDSAAMRLRFEGMLEAYQHGMQQAPAARGWYALNSWIGSWWPSQPALQFGLAAVLFVVGVVASPYLRSNAEQQSNELSELRSELRDTRQLVALSLMQQQSTAERLKGVQWSTQIDQPGNELVTAVLDLLRHDPNVNVRMVAVEALAKFAESEIARREALLALTVEENPLIQTALIKLMVDLEETESVDVLQMMMQDATVNEGVRQYAALALEHFQ